MAIVAIPDALHVRGYGWELDRPAQINRSAYTGKRQVAANPWHGKWTAKVEFAPCVGEQSIRALRAFAASLRGAVNSFRLPATEGQQRGLQASVAASAAAQGATALSVTGTYLRPGHLVTVNDQLLVVVTSTPASTGCTITFEPNLRAAVASGASLNVSNPTCLVALSASSIGWSVELGPVYGLSLDVEEVF